MVKGLHVDHIERCARCILPSSLPRVTLGEDGVCNHCARYDAWLSDFRETEGRRRQESEKVQRRRGGGHDIAT
jgi:hypothetical protein